MHDYGLAGPEFALEVHHAIRDVVAALLPPLLLLVPAFAAEPDCVECHKKESPALVMEWQRSKNAAANVSCVQCHQADETNPGAWLHHGASMMGPDYRHWHGMYEVAKTFYVSFLPHMVQAARAKSPALGRKWRAKIDLLLAGDEHVWL